MASVSRKISRTCSPCRAQSCSSGHLVLVKELAKGWGLGWESHSHYPCHCEKCLLSLRGFQKCVFRPVCYSYHSCGPAKSKASSGAERRDEQLDWSVCRAQLEQAGWRGSSAHSSADAHTHIHTHAHAHTQVSLAHLLSTRLAQWGKTIPPTQTWSTTIKIFLTQWLPKQTCLHWHSSILIIN